MRNPVYLMQSRHNVYYFRWPMPITPANPDKAHIRLSLGTREPREALRLAKILEYHARQIEGAYGGELMNDSEAKTIIQDYFREIIKKRKDRIIDNGPLNDDQIAQIRSSIKNAEEWIGLAKDGVEVEEDNTIEKINHAMNLKIEDFSSDAAKLKNYYNQAYPAMLREILRFNDEHAGFDFTPLKHNPIQTTASKHPLDEIGQKFIDMHMRDKQWDDNTKREKESYIAVLKEILGKKFNITDMDAEKARNVRDIIIRIPVNRNKNAKTRNLSLLAAIEVKGIEPIAAATIKKYLDCYKALFGWCMNEAYIDRNPFQSIRGKVAAKKREDRRIAFTEDQIKTMLTELDARKIAKKDYAYWGTLIGIYTGARLNEVAQIMLDDIKQEDGIWYFDMNDDGDDKKLKNEASRRRVPIHEALIKRGLLDYAQKVKDLGKVRLLHELTYCKKNGYGKNLGRFFNEKFLIQLGLKNKQAVFHSLRHTVVTRLTQAGHDEKKTKAIIGHTQSGTALKTYFAEGFKMADIKLVIDTLHE